MFRAVALGVVLIQLANTQPNKLHSCRIMVVDPVGAPIAGARVLVRPNLSAGSATPDDFMRTDNNGQLGADVPEGIADVCVLSPGFAPACKQIKITDRDTRVMFKLQISKFAEMVE
jgi:hypothetical protein